MIPQAAALLRHYAQHHEDRKLPWRRPREPVHRLAMVEALLAQTKARSVAEHYGAVFYGVRSGSDWLELDGAERDRRVQPLGLGRQKRKTMDCLAEALEDGAAVLWPQAMVMSKGIDLYTAAMVALLHGAHAIPFGDILERVGQRASFDGEPGPWINKLLHAAATMCSATGRPPAYEVACAVMDLGATRCRQDHVECPRCPLCPWCIAKKHLGRQAELGLPDPELPWIPISISVPVRIINEGVDDWEQRNARIEVGWRQHEPGLPPRPADVAPAILLAIRGAIGEEPTTYTGELNFHGKQAYQVAKQAADGMPWEDIWVRIVIGDGSGTVTAWGSDDSIDNVSGNS